MLTGKTRPDHEEQKIKQEYLIEYDSKKVRVRYEKFTKATDKIIYEENEKVSFEDPLGRYHEYINGKKQKTPIDSPPPTLAKITQKALREQLPNHILRQIEDLNLDDTV